MQRYDLTPDEAAHLNALVSADFLGDFGTADSDDWALSFALESGTMSKAVPGGLRNALETFRDQRPRHGVLLIRGLPIVERNLPPTPETLPIARNSVRECEALLMLCGSILGEAFGWLQQQEGALVHNIFPMKFAATMQVGASSTTELAWHTEDAFHAARADFIGLLCLRNLEKASTTVANLDGLSLEGYEALWEPSYLIYADDSYYYGCDRASEASDSGLREAPDPVSVFFGTADSPFLRIDPAYMKAVPNNERAACALQRLSTEIEARLTEIELSTGDLLFIDNYRAVHGRRPFEARYDGKDRWLKRINLCSDPRRVTLLRATPNNRIISLR